MKKKIRRILGLLAGTLFFFTGVVYFKEKKIGKGDILPLYFHNPTKKLFINVIRWLEKKGYTFISTDELVEILAYKKVIDKKAVWISFDDCWKDNLNNVIPILKNKKIPATFFCSTGPVESNGVFWFTMVRENKKILEKKYAKNVELLWEVSDAEREKVFFDVINNHPRCKREVMTKNDIIELSRLPNITIGNHTVNHFATKSCNAETLKYEIAEANRKIEEWTSKRPLYFAYPKGLYSGKEKRCLLKNGIKLAATIEEFTIKSDKYRETDLLFVPRYTIPDDVFIPEVVCHIIGIWQPFIRRLKSKLVF